MLHLFKKLKFNFILKAMQIFKKCTSLYRLLKTIVTFPLSFLFYRLWKKCCKFLEHFVYYYTYHCFFHNTKKLTKVLKIQILIKKFVLFRNIFILIFILKYWRYLMLWGEIQYFEFETQKEWNSTKLVILANKKKRYGS